MTMQEDAWREANQRHLAAALAEVRDLLQGKTPEIGPEIEPEGGTLTTLDALTAMFELSPFERRVLLLCAGIELDPSFGPRHATFGLSLAAFPDAHWSALAPTSALRRWRLIEIAAGDEGLSASPLRIDERILHYLLGVPCVDERLHGIVVPSGAPTELAPSQLAVAERLARLWSRAERAADCPVVQLGGDDVAGRSAVAAAACAQLGLQLWTMDAADIPASGAERETLARLWERESILVQAALLIESEGVSGPETRALAPFVERLQGAVLVSGGEPLRSRSRPVVGMEVDRPGAAEQAALWREALGAVGQGLNGEVDRVAAQFRLSPSAIREAGSEVLQKLAGKEIVRDLSTLLWDTGRAQARPRLADLAQRVEALATWEDLVLPEPQLETLRAIVAHVRRRALVYDGWGFARKSARGLGIGALFSGASGTGKTLAAEVLANELRLDLHRIDLALLVSKYIGETEKNLKRVFDAAEEGGAILLFDEADALFGKRSEVKDSHDRYANIEVSYLLQRVEAYRGLVILTTNLQGTIDSAFLRRLRFIVQFPFPDAEQRAEIWRRVFPSATPTEGLDMDRLSRLSLSGGNIRNLALNAAFLAADAGERVGMKHLLRAAHGEYAKLEKPLSEAEIGGWE